jgi:hypothetical protein
VRLSGQQARMLACTCWIGSPNGVGLQSAFRR